MMYTLPPNICQMFQDRVMQTIGYYRMLDIMGSSMDELPLFL